MMSEVANPIRLLDYRPPAWTLSALDLEFHLDAECTLVRARMQVERRQEADPALRAERNAPLRLYGRELTLQALAINGQPPTPTQLVEDAEGLLLQDLPEQAEISLETRIHPARNTALEGLYLSGSTLCTQCEPEGFRRLLFFPDRPDVLTRYRVRLEADAQRYPVLLANGNRVASGTLEAGRHYAVWEDPFPKPSYLFALVAGDLACERQPFVTASGREVMLEIYVEPHNQGRCAHALASLARAMRYDEQAFGREYDLDVYMIVAVDDFNMGAMENKGLNLFNAKYVLASPETATDEDYVGIESVIAHEYFHNWSGNRITCRDWFQLSLKEGLTVFRDQCFTTDNTLFGVKRIDDVKLLRSVQFPEDAGPLAHPVRPDQYQAINNFYTATVYEKGAEVIRMLQTLLGPTTFRAGLDTYFARHDGQAVTVEDFLAAMASASNQDLSAFQRWYTQAGTPQVRVHTEYEPNTGTVYLECQQHTPATPGQMDKQPLVIPLALTLLDAQGEAMPAHLVTEQGRLAQQTDWVLVHDRAKQTFTLSGLSTAPTALVWLRAFSAPIQLEAEQTTAELAHILAYAQDAFSRWDAAQTLLRRAIIARTQTQADAPLEAAITQAYAALLETQTRIEPILLAALLELPSHQELSEWLAPADPLHLDQARRATEHAVFQPLAPALAQAQPEQTPLDHEQFTAQGIGQRRLRNRLLALRVALRQSGALDEAVAQYQAAQSLTLRMGALAALNQQDAPQREALLADFEQRALPEPLLLDRWFALEAACPLSGGFARMDRLLTHPGFRWTNPNRVRAVLAPFMRQNYPHFHQADGAGYRYIGAHLEHLDGLNPQTAASLARPLTRWRNLDPQRAEAMQAVLERLAKRPGLSHELGDVVQRALG